MIGAPPTSGRKRLLSSGCVRQRRLFRSSAKSTLPQSRLVFLAGEQNSSCAGNEPRHANGCLAVWGEPVRLIYANPTFVS